MVGYIACMYSHIMLGHLQRVNLTNSRAVYTEGDLIIVDMS